MNDEKLIRMANQIARFHATQMDGHAGSVADHLKDFWAPPMRTKLARVGQADPDALHPLAREALALLRATSDPSDD
ncbi:formate dehydrogenase subunit delta [Aliiroseovarius sp. PTFE2010]|uniref:formate dehydrogenase subunit delta n=1 Tax=Aliiroseovarius sp. PTFE2010 TaxID=3417190 RepID=UPI003CEF02DC